MGDIILSVNHPLNIDKLRNSKRIDQDHRKRIVNLHANGLCYMTISNQLILP